MCNGAGIGAAGPRTASGEVTVLDIFTYVAFFVIMAGCVWILDGALKNESD